MKTATQTVFDSARTTKLRTFGKGLLRSVPYAGRMPYTQADLDAAAQLFADEAAFDASCDRMAEESAALDRMCRGLDAY